MRYCSRCGAPLDDTANFCNQCGSVAIPDSQQPPAQPEAPYIPQQPYAVAPQQPYVAAPQQPYAAPQQLYTAPNPATSDTLGLLIKIFMLVSTISWGFLIFCLIPPITLGWQIPMTIMAWKKIDRGEPISTAFAVCSLIFVNMIPGILMLVRPTAESSTKM